MLSILLVTKYINIYPIGLECGRLEVYKVINMFQDSCLQKYFIKLCINPLDIYNMLIYMNFYSALPL